MRSARKCERRGQLSRSAENQQRCRRVWGRRLSMDGIRDSAGPGCKVQRDFLPRLSVVGIEAKARPERGASPGLETVVLSEDPSCRPQPLVSLREGKVPQGPAVPHSVRFWDSSFFSPRGLSLFLSWKFGWYKNE